MSGVAAAKRQEDIPSKIEMPFPSSERIVFARNPLAEVICQLRYPPILEIGASEPAEFQSAIRHRYPLYQKQVPGIAPAEISAMIQKLGLRPQVPTTHRFSMLDEEHHAAIANESFSVTTNQYSNWEHFYAEVRAIQTAFEAIYKPAVYTRIGLRYIDVIDRDELGLGNASWAELVKAPFCGPLSEPVIARAAAEMHLETQIDLPANLAVKIRAGLGQVEEADARRDVFVFDCDFFTKDRSNCDDVDGILGTFNRAAGDLFRWAITGTLRDALGRVAADGQ
jgi:uncharacterized protein (TIGR04255 family)